MEKVLITGSSGFLGSHTMRLLRASGIEAIGADRRPSESTNLVCSIGDEAAMTSGLKSGGIGTVLHLAASVDAEESVRQPVEYIRNNTLNTAHLLNAMRKAGSGNFVFVSSAAVYGEPKHLPIDETHETNPTNPYGLSKLLAEEVVQGYNESYGIKYAILRPTNLYGTGQNSSHAGVIAKFIEAAIRGTPPVLQGDGKQTRDFLHVSDMAEALKAVASKGVRNDTYNVSANRPVDLSELLAIIEKISGTKLNAVHEQGRKGDIGKSEVSSDKLRAEYGWKPKKTLEEGLADLLSAGRQRG